MFRRKSDLRALRSAYFKYSTLSHINMVNNDALAVVATTIPNPSSHC